MKVFKDDIIRKQFHPGFARTKPVIWLVVHGTAGGGTLNWVKTAKPGDERYRNYKNGIALFHDYIDRDGNITNIIDHKRWVYHASIGQLDGGTIGVELSNPTRDNSGPYTLAQYESLVEYYGSLLNSFPEMTTILSHNRCKQKISGGSKVCPGPAFNWSLVCDLLDADGFAFKYDSKYESIWDITE